MARRSTTIPQRAIDRVVAAASDRRWREITAAGSSVRIVWRPGADHDTLFPDDTKEHDHDRNDRNTP